MWQKRETKVIEVAGSQSGFPKKSFSPLMSTGVCSVSSTKMLNFGSEDRSLEVCDEDEDEYD